jgi:hypothetical protein
MMLKLVKLFPVKAMWYVAAAEIVSPDAGIYA